MVQKIKLYIRALWELVTFPITWYQDHKAFKKRMKELQEKDPFIYK
jgi:hypothetical protein